MEKKRPSLWEWRRSKRRWSINKPDGIVLTPPLLPRNVCGCWKTDIKKKKKKMAGKIQLLHESLQKANRITRDKKK